MDNSTRTPGILFESETISRRRLLTASAGVAATVMGMPLTHAAEAAERRREFAKESRPVNCAFIGVGDQGYGVDYKAAMSVPGVKMVAVCDIYEPFLNRALRDAPGAKGYKDYREVMDRKDVEAVLIATPLFMHAPVALAALQSGKHVFCEKMMAYTIEDAKRMARAAISSKRVLQIGHQRHANIMYNHAWELITQKKVCGPITHIRAQWNRNGNWRKPALPGMTDRQRNWRLYHEYSKGLVSELACHQIDAVNWFLGSHPTAVVAMGGIDYWKDGRTVPDNVELIYEYPNGVKLNYTSITTNQYDGYYEQFMGKDGTLLISEEPETPSSYYREPSAPVEDWMKVAVGGSRTGKHREVGLNLDPQATKKITGPGVKIGDASFGADSLHKSSYVLEQEDFFNSIRTGAPICCDWKAALGVAVAGVRGVEAIAHGSRVDIPASDYELG